MNAFLIWWSSNEHERTNRRHKNTKVWEINHLFVDPAPHNFFVFMASLKHDRHRGS